MNLQDFFVLALMTLGIASSVAPTRAHAEVIERIEAIINKKAVYKSDVDHFREQVGLRSKIDPIFANDPLAKNPNPTDYQIVNYLIDEAMILDKFPVTDAEVEQEIGTIQTNLKIDREQLRGAIAREGFKFEDYFKLMRASLAKRQLIDREIRNKAAVSDDDIRSEYNRERAGSKSFQGSFHLFIQKFSKKDYKSSALARDDAEKALSAATKSGTFGGEDLGYLAYSEMSPTLQKIVQALGPEKLSDVFEDGDAYLIVKTGDIKSDLDSAPEHDKDALRGKLMEAEFEHQIKLWLERERSNNYVKFNIKET